MKTLKLTIASLLFVSAAFVISCKKSSDNATNPTNTDEAATAADNASAENTSNDVISIAAEATDGSNILSNYRMAPSNEELAYGCVDSITNTNKVITVYFNGSACKDGRTRSGQLIFDYSGSTGNAIHYRDPGFKLHITSNGYRVNNNSVSVDKRVTNITDTVAGGGFNFDPSKVNEKWSDTTQLTIQTNNGTFNWNCQRTKELLNTNNPAIYHGDSANSQHITWKLARIGISGSAHGTTVDNETFTAVTTSQLVRDFGACSPWTPFIWGTIDFTPGTKPTRHIDFGYMKNPPDSCDNWISVTINSNIYYRQIW